MVSHDTLNVALHALKELEEHCPNCGEKFSQECFMEHDECPCCGDELDKGNIKEISDAIADIEVELGIRAYVERGE